MSAADALFSAYAEVFPSLRALSPLPGTFLCLRRGVSAAVGAVSTIATFSLPTQRCFLPTDQKAKDRQLFSAYAEVFLSERQPFNDWASFLCLRRGVSSWQRSARSVSCFSLPTQRCFYLEEPEDGAAGLFSAYAEVFPRKTTAKAS